MTVKRRHCKTITSVPSVATTPIQIKFQYLGDFLVHLENIRLSAPWGIVYPKSA